VDGKLIDMAESSQPLLECRALARHFGALKAVRDVSLTLHHGEILGIGGPNGAGKTTLFEVLSRFLPASAGSIAFMGQDITQASARTALKLGMARVFQANTAFDTLTARENVMIGAVFGQGNMPVRFSREARATAADSLERVGLAGKADVVAGELSVLDRKLLMFASALACEPKVLLLDEPVGGLTQPEMHQIAVLVRSLANAGLGILLIEHVMRFMTELADRIMVLHHGEVIFQGQPAQMARNETVRAIYLGEKAAARLEAQIGNGPSVELPHDRRAS
jgi:branched-chain amino acid transport system ATP-binding protein